MHLSGSFMISDALPYLRWLDLDGKEKEMKRIAKELDEFAQVWLEEHKRNRNSGEGELKGKHDFMDVLLSVVDQGEEFEGRDADTTVKATCLALIIAGTDTTTGTMTWALSLLINNQEALKKVVHELDTHVGKDRLVVESDLKSLVYLQAIIKETLRLYPAAPLNLPHESMEDCTIGGYHVPAGTRLFTNIYKLQRDPFVYNDPLEFRPERFLTTHKDKDLRGQHFELIPFSAGRRVCPGISFALQIMQLTLANLLHGFDIVTSDGEQVNMHEISGLTNIKASPLHVILTSRLTPQVYNEN
ncbi:putative cytochrome P450 [Lupinus albus]|uniref:Putative cytochrome P450 n=1 Tax=Lupinus albus TaxID=3870 RepID=A0A6A4N664_LUPAL|nr:putative cytochrome P450 [Lupinus albus]